MPDTLTGSTLLDDIIGAAGVPTAPEEDEPPVPGAPPPLSLGERPPPGPIRSYLWQGREPPALPTPPPEPAPPPPPPPRRTPDLARGHRRNQEIRAFMKIQGKSQQEIDSLLGPELPESGVIGGTLRQGIRGVLSGVQLPLQALQAADAPGGTDVLRNLSEKAQKALQGVKPLPTLRGAHRGYWESGVESAAQSVTAGLLVGVPTLLLTRSPTITGLALGGVYGAAEYAQTRDQLMQWNEERRQQGLSTIPQSLIQSTALWSGIIEWGMEALADRFFIGRLMQYVPGSRQAGEFALQYARRRLPTILREAGLGTLNEATTEAATALAQRWAQTEASQALGIPQPSYWEAAGEATIVGGIAGLLGGGGIATGRDVLGGLRQHAPAPPPPPPPPPGGTTTTPPPPAPPGAPGAPGTPATPPGTPAIPVMTQPTTAPLSEDEAFAQAKRLVDTGRFTPEQVQNILISQGMDAPSATAVMARVQAGAGTIPTTPITTPPTTTPPPPPITTTPTTPAPPLDVEALTDQAAAHIAQEGWPEVRNLMLQTPLGRPLSYDEAQQVLEALVQRGVLEPRPPGVFSYQVRQPGAAPTTPTPAPPTTEGDWEPIAGTPAPPAPGTPVRVPVADGGVEDATIEATSQEMWDGGNVALRFTKDGFRAVGPVDVVLRQAAAPVSPPPAVTPAPATPAPTTPTPSLTPTPAPAPVAPEPAWAPGFPAGTNLRTLDDPPPRGTRVQVTQTDGTVESARVIGTSRDLWESGAVRVVYDEGRFVAPVSRHQVTVERWAPGERVVPGPGEVLLSDTQALPRRGTPVRILGPEGLLVDGRVLGTRQDVWESGGVNVRFAREQRSDTVPRGQVVLPSAPAAAPIQPSPTPGPPAPAPPRMVTEPVQERGIFGPPGTFGGFRGVGQPPRMTPTTEPEATPTVPGEPPTPHAAPTEPAPAEAPPEAAAPYSIVLLRPSPAMTEQILDLGTRLIAEDDVHPTEGREDDPHVTVKYGIETDDPTVVEGIMTRLRPVSATITGLEVFRPEDQEYEVIVLALDSPDLQALHEQLTAQTPNVETFPTYRPHITLGYVRPGRGVLYESDLTPLDGQRLSFATAEFRNRQRETTLLTMTGQARPLPPPIEEAAAPSPAPPATETPTTPEPEPTPTQTYAPPMATTDVPGGYYTLDEFALRQRPKQSDIGITAASRATDAQWRRVTIEGETTAWTNGRMLDLQPPRYPNFPRHADATREPQDVKTFWTDILAHIQDRATTLLTPVAMREAIPDDRIPVRVVFALPDGRLIDLNVHYVAHLQTTYPTGEWRGWDPMKPVVRLVEGRIVGIISPSRIGETDPKTYDALVQRMTGTEPPTPAAEPEAPAEGPPAGAPEPTDILPEGTRVMLEDGRHGVVTRVETFTMRPVMGGAGAGQRTVIYDITTDAGTIVRSMPQNRVRVEDTPAPAVIPDPVVDGRALPPDELRGHIRREKRREAEAWAARRRARSQASKQAYAQTIQRAQQAAGDLQAILTAWEQEHGITPEAVPTPPTPAPGAVPGMTWERTSRGTLEARFPSKPAQAVLDRLRAAGFKWARGVKTWWAQETPERVQMLTEMQQGTAPAPEAAPEAQPTAAPEPKAPAPPERPAVRFPAGTRVLFPTPGGGSAVGTITSDALEGGMVFVQADAPRFSQIVAVADLQPMAPEPTPPTEESATPPTTPAQPPTLADQAASMSEEDIARAWAEAQAANEAEDAATALQTDAERIRQEMTQELQDLRGAGEPSRSPEDADAETFFTTWERLLMGRNGIPVMELWEEIRRTEGWEPERFDAAGSLLTTQGRLAMYPEAGGDIVRRPPRAPRAPGSESRTGPTTGTSPQAAEPTARDLADRAAREALGVADNVIKGLDALFGGGQNRLGMGPTFDEDTYAQALPFFQQAARDAQALGKTITQLFQYFLRRYGQVIVPYGTRFITDLGAGRITLEEEGKVEEYLSSLGNLVRQHLKTYRPTMYRELVEAGELEAVVESRVEAAVEMMERLERRGVHPGEAYSLALEEHLLPPGETEMPHLGEAPPDTDERLPGADSIFA